MKKILCTIFLLPVLCVALSGAKAEDLLVEDELSPDAPITDITLAWDASQDGVGYNLYYGRVSGVYIRGVTVTNTSAVVGVRGTRTVYFAVTAFNADGVESDYSDEVHWP
jgi:hypothetical protein